MTIFKVYQKKLRIQKLPQAEFWSIMNNVDKGILSADAKREPDLSVSVISKGKDHS